MDGDEQKKAHEHFSESCFSDVWKHLDNPSRSEDDVEEMINLAHASLWHWSKRPDATGKHFSRLASPTPARISSLRWLSCLTPRYRISRLSKQI